MKKLTELFSEQSHDKRTAIIAAIESGSLPVFMYVDHAELQRIYHSGESELEHGCADVGGVFLQVYPHKAVSVIQGGGPHTANFLVTDEPFDERIHAVGLHYDAKPALRSIEQLHVDPAALVLNAQGAVRIYRNENWTELTFEFADGKLEEFSLNQHQALLLRHMIDRAAPCTSRELKDVLARNGIEEGKIIGTTNGVFDFNGIFRTRAKHLVKSLGRGHYVLSDLWGKCPKVQAK